MLNNEPKLLKEALQLIDGDLVKMRQVLLRYSLTKVIAGFERLDAQQQQITMAVAILSEFPISSCKTLLIRCGYVPSYQTDILKLLSHNKRWKQDEYGVAYQILAEVNILADYIENNCPGGKECELQSLFKTETGSSILNGLLTNDDCDRDMPPN